MNERDRSDDLMCAYNRKPNKIELAHVCWDFIDDCSPSLHGSEGKWEPTWWLASVLYAGCSNLSWKQDSLPIKEPRYRPGKKGLCVSD